MKIGVAGLGLVGSALGSRLLTAGHKVIGFDIDSRAKEQFRVRFPEASVVNSLDALRSCSVLITAVMRTEDVAQIVQSLGFERDTKPLITSVIDCSTGDANQLRALSQSLRILGVAFIEAPLSGSSEQIAQGHATMLLGGDAAEITLVEPLLDVLCPKRLTVGPAGAAANAKLATNLVLGLNRAALAEGMAFAESLGISRKQFLELILNTPATSEAAKQKGQRMVNQHYEPQSRIRQHLKDVDMMLTQAKTLNQRLPLSEVHAALMRDGVRSGLGDLDNAAIIEVIARGRTGS